MLVVPVGVGSAGGTGVGAGSVGGVGVGAGVGTRAGPFEPPPGGGPPPLGAGTGAGAVIVGGVWLLGPLEPDGAAVSPGVPGGGAPPVPLEPWWDALSSAGLVL